MARTYSHLRTMSVRKANFDKDGNRNTVVTDDDEIIVLYNENKISKNDLVSAISEGNSAFMDKILCINKCMADQLSD